MSVKFKKQNQKQKKEAKAEAKAFNTEGTESTEGYWLNIANHALVVNS